MKYIILIILLLWIILSSLFVQQKCIGTMKELKLQNDNILFNDDYMCI